MKGFFLIILGILLMLSNVIEGLWFWDFGNVVENDALRQLNGAISISMKSVNILIPKRPCTKTRYVRVEVDDPDLVPKVYFNKLTNIVTITYTLVRHSESFYTIIWQYSPIPNCRNLSRPLHMSGWRDGTKFKTRYEDSNFAMDYYYGGMDRNLGDLPEFEDIEGLKKID